MKHFFHLNPLFAGLLLLAVSCNCDDPFDNPLDPASKNYISPFDPAKGILIDDFDDGQDPNLLGSCPSIFKAQQADVDTFYHSKHENVLRGVGRSMQIKFDVSKFETASGGWVQPLVDTCPGKSSRIAFNLEALNVTALTFWIKTESPRINLEIALKDTTIVGQTGPKRLLWSNRTPQASYLRPDNSWQKVTIPISHLTPNDSGAPVNLRILREINFGFGRQRFEDEGGDLTGTLYIDEIAFER